MLLFFVYFREFAIIKDILVQPGFLINVTLASIFQVIFTFVLLYLFKFSNFVVGTSLSKTEVVQVALFEYLILNEKLNIIGISGIIISTLGVIILSIKNVKFFFQNIFSKTTKKKFSINEIWTNQMKQSQLFGYESKLEFLHTTDLMIYNKILKNQ